MNNTSTDHDSYVWLIHGTFAAPKIDKTSSNEFLWYQKGSGFYNKLNEKLESKQFSNIIWRGMDPIFTWSGENNHLARINAAIDLADKINEIIINNPSAKFHLIAHSHGGNVILSAIENLMKTRKKLNQECFEMIISKFDTNVMNLIIDNNLKELDMKIDEEAVKVLNEIQDFLGKRLNRSLITNENVRNWIDKRVAHIRANSETQLFCILKECRVKISNHEKYINIFKARNELIKFKNIADGYIVKYQKASLNFLLSYKYSYESFRIIIDPENELLINNIGSCVFIGTPFLRRRWANDNRITINFIIECLLFSFALAFLVSMGLIVWWPLLSIVQFIIQSLIYSFLFNHNLPSFNIGVSIKWLIRVFIATQIISFIYILFTRVFSEKEIKMIYIKANMILRNSTKVIINQAISSSVYKKYQNHRIIKFMEIYIKNISLFALNAQVHFIKFIIRNKPQNILKEKYNTNIYFDEKFVDSFSQKIPALVVHAGFMDEAFAALSSLNLTRIELNTTIDNYLNLKFDKQMQEIIHKLSAMVTNTVKIPLLCHPNEKSSLRSSSEQINSIGLTTKYEDFRIISNEIIKNIHLFFLLFCNFIELVTFPITWPFRTYLINPWIKKVFIEAVSSNAYGLPPEAIEGATIDVSQKMGLIRYFNEKSYFLKMNNSNMSSISNHITLLQSFAYCLPDDNDKFNERFKNEIQIDGLRSRLLKRLDEALLKDMYSYKTSMEFELNDIESRKFEDYRKDNLMLWFGLVDRIRDLELVHSSYFYDEMLINEIVEFVIKSDHCKPTG